MRHLSLPVQTPWLLRRSLLLVLVAIAMGLLSACSIWPKSLNPWAEPEPVKTEPAPAAAAPMPPAAPAPEAPAPEVQPSAVASPVMPRAEVINTPATGEPMKAPSAPPSTAMPGDKPTTSTSTMPSNKAVVLVPGYYINVGLFAVPANGTKAYNKLEAAGLPVFSDPVKKNEATVTRVRVGPFATQAKAAAAAKKIRTLKLEAVIFKH